MSDDVKSEILAAANGDPKGHNAPGTDAVAGDPAAPAKEKSEKERMFTKELLACRIKY